MRYPLVLTESVSPVQSDHHPPLSTASSELICIIKETYLTSSFLAGCLALYCEILGQPGGV